SQHVQVDVQPPAWSLPAHLFRRLAPAVSRMAMKLLYAIEPHAIRDTGRADLAPIAFVALPQQHERIRLQRWYATAQRLWRATDAKQDRDLHVGGLTRGRSLYGGGVFMAVDEEQTGRPVDVTQRRNGAQQHCAVSPIEQRPAPQTKRRLYARVHRVDHGQER